MPPSYVYGAPYLNAGSGTTGLVPLQATQLSHAAAITAATNQFYEYQNAVATAAAAQYPNQYTAAAGYDAYSYSPATAAAVAGKREINWPANCVGVAKTNRPFCLISSANAAAGGYIPYTYAALPQTGASTTGAYPGMAQYQGTGGAALQEARLQ